MQWADRVKYD